MDQILGLATLVRERVREHAGNGYHIQTYAVLDDKSQIYAAITVTDPDYPLAQSREVVVMARVVGETVIINKDITDRPLAQALIGAGIPRAQTVLTYAGEAMLEQ